MSQDETMRLRHKIARALSQPVEPLTDADLVDIEAELRRLAAVETLAREAVKNCYFDDRLVKLLEGKGDG